MASDWIFLWQTVNELPFLSSSLKELLLSLSTMRSERSCKWLILLFIPLQWNIHIKGQYPNCDSIKDFIKTLLCFMLAKFDNLARTESFLPAFLHNKDTDSLKFRFLFICAANLVTFAYYCPKFVHVQFEPKHFHVIARQQQVALTLS